MSEKSIKTGIATVLIIGVGAVAGFKFFEKIDNGYVGVAYSMNGGVKDEVLNQGIKYVGLDKVIQYPIRLQTVGAKDISVSTKDGKKITIDLKYDYKVDPTATAKMFKEFGNVNSEDLEKGWIRSRLQKEAREIYANYNILDLLSGQSSSAEDALLKNFSESVEQKGFLVESITASVPDVDKETQDTIDGIIRSGQNNQRAKLDAETEKTQAETEASVAKTKADTKAYEIQKAAEAEAEANKKLAESITPDLIKYEEAQARKKHGWTTIKGADAIVVDEKGK